MESVWAGRPVRRGCVAAHLPAAPVSGGARMNATGPAGSSEPARAAGLPSMEQGDCDSAPAAAPRSAGGDNSLRCRARPRRSGRQERADDRGTKAPKRCPASLPTISPGAGPRPGGWGPLAHLGRRLTVSVLRLPHHPLAAPSPDGEAEPRRDDDDGKQTEPALDLVHVRHHFLQLVREEVG